MGMNDRVEPKRKRDHNGKAEHDVTPAYVFVNVDLTETHKADLAECAWEAEQSWSFYILSIVAGYKMSLSWDKPTGTYTASMTDQNIGSVCRSWILTARSNDVDKAIKALWYKHTVILKDGWELHMAKPKATVEYA